MRLVILLLAMLVSVCRVSCQQPFLLMPAVTDSMEEEDIPDINYNRDYRKGVSLYEKGSYAQAEKYFRKAAAIYKTEEAAHYLYYSILFQGHDLQAAAFRRKQARYTFFLPPYKKGLEALYTDIGPRISANANAGNIYYADVGAFYRLSPKMRLWQTVAWLQQDNNLGDFKQYESFTALKAYLKRGWTLTPSVHYDYVPYTTLQTGQDSVFYTASYYDEHDTISYKTRALQVIQQTIPGHTHFLNISLAAAKRAGAFTFEAEPSFHYMPGKSRIDYSYTSNGVTDSFEHNKLQGSRPFHESGGGSKDTAAWYYSAQLGGAVTWRLPIPGEPVTIRAAYYYLWDEGGQKTSGYHLSALLWWYKSYRVFLSVVKKGNLPLALHSEGLYFNYSDPIEVRTSASFQLYPLKKWSPMLTYQYESDTREQDGAKLIYHSLYFTLKYSL